MNPLNTANPINAAIIEETEKTSKGISGYEVLEPFSLPIHIALSILFALILIFVANDWRKKRKIEKAKKEQPKPIKLKDVKYRGNHGIRSKK